MNDHLAQPNVAAFFHEELNDYLRSKRAMEAEERLIVEEFNKETKRLRREAGRRYAEMLGLDPDRFAEPAAALILSPKRDWRLKAARFLIDAFKRQARASTPRRRKVAVA